jgi:hypothetical protein
VHPGGWTESWDGRYVPLYHLKSAAPQDDDRIELKAGEEHTADFRLAKIEAMRRLPCSRWSR